jgi:hypothetical protein
MNIPEELTKFITDWVYNLHNLNNISLESLMKFTSDLNYINDRYKTTFSYDDDTVWLFIVEMKEWEPIASAEKGLVFNEDNYILDSDGRVIAMRGQGDSKIKSSGCICFEVKQLKRELSINEITDTESST